MLLVSIRAFTAAGSPPTEYNLSGITAYEGNPGLKYNSLLYAGSQDVVNLMLTQIAELMNFASLS